MKFKNRILKRIGFIGLVIFLLAACSGKHEIPSTVIELPDGYNLIFQDEFNGEALDTTVWGFHNLGKRRSAVNVKEACLTNGNGELEIRNWTELHGESTF